MSRYTEEEKAAILAEARANIAMIDEMRGEFRDPHDLTNVVRFTPKPEPEPEPRPKRSFSETTIQRMVNGVREETANQFAMLRGEIEADVSEIHAYVAGELSSLLTETFNSIANEFDAVHDGLQTKAIESYVADLKADVAAMRSEMDSLRSLVEHLISAVAGLRDSVETIEATRSGSVVALRKGSP